MAEEQTQALAEPDVKTLLSSVVTDRSGTPGELMGLAYPLVVSFLSFSIMGIVDTIVLGHVGTAEQGGAGLGMSLIWTFISLFAGTLGIMSTFVSQANGGGRTHTINRWVVVGLILILPMSLVMLTCIHLIIPMLDMMGTSDEVRPHAATYMAIRIYGTPFVLVNFALSGFLRGLADTKTPMIVTVIANIINLLLNIVLVFGVGPIPAFGLAGAAWATVAAGGVSGAIYLGVYLSKTNHARFQTRTWVWVTPEEFWRFLKVGLPAGTGWFIESLAWTVMAIFVASIDPAGLAAHVIVFQIITFSFMPAAALSVASSTLVGQYLGAERVDLALRSARASIAVGVSIMASVGLCFALFRETVMGLFNSDPAVIATGSTLLLIAACFQVFDAIGITITGVLRGAGDTRFPMYAQLGAGWLIFVPLVFLFGRVFDMGVVGAWLGALVFVVLLGVLLILRFVGGKWKHMRIA